MPIIRADKNKDFTVVSNAVFRDVRLSAKSRLIYCTICSLPDDWVLSLKGLESITGESREWVRKGVKELEIAGYISMKRINKANGYLETEWTFCELPNSNYVPLAIKKIITPCVKPETIHDIKEVTPVKETKPPKKGCRLPDDWKPSDKLIEWVDEKQKEKKITLDIPDVTFEFCNYWHSKAGANVTKIDWDKTFQNWIIKQFQYASKYKQPEKPTAQKPADYYDTSKNKYFIERD